MWGGGNKSSNSTVRIRKIQHFLKVKVSMSKANLTSGSECPLQDCCVQAMPNELAIMTHSN